MAAGAGLALLPPLKLLLHGELIKGLVQREQPGSTIPGAILRDVPSAGVAYPSGHAVIAAGIVVLLAPYVRRPPAGRARALALLNAAARVYLGAHAPLDVVGGAAAGAAIGALLNLAVGVAPRPAGGVSCAGPLRRRSGRAPGRRARPEPPPSDRARS